MVDLRTKNGNFTILDFYIENKRQNRYNLGVYFAVPYRVKKNNNNMKRNKSKKENFDSLEIIRVFLNQMKKNTFFKIILHFWIYFHYFIFILNIANSEKCIFLLFKLLC